MSDILTLLDTLGPCDPALRIGVVDGTPDLAIPALGDARLDLEPTMRIAEAHGPDAHGTEICSVLFDREGGLARGCSGLILPVFFPDPRPAYMAPRATQTDIARGIYMAVERGVAIVNISAGQLSSTPEASRHLEDALDLCERKGILVVAATGNDGCACLHVPAAVASVLAVGAMDAAGRPLQSSNFGASYGANGILAPGAGLTVSSLRGERVQRSGSSFATAVVTGVAARLLSAARRAGRSFGPLDIRRILIETARPGDPQADGECARVLAGRLDVRGAIERLRQTLEPELEGAVFLPRSGNDQSGREPMIRETLSVSPSAATMSPPGRSGIAGAVLQSDCGCGCGGKKQAAQQELAAGDDGGDDDDGDDDVEVAGAMQSTRPVRRRRGALAEAREVRQSSVTQQGCGCGGAAKEPQKVYAIGSVWFDFGNEPRYDAIVQRMGDPVAANTPAALIDMLKNDLSFATGITFILMQEQIPIYAITPAGPLAQEVYADLLGAMQTSLDNTGDLQRVAIPGSSTVRRG